MFYSSHGIRCSYLFGYFSVKTRSRCKRTITRCCFVVVLYCASTRPRCTVVLIQLLTDFVIALLI